MMLWDPLNAAAAARCWLWALLALVVCLLQGPRFVQSLRPLSDDGVDFFQEWSSGRFYFDGLPIYSDLRVSVERYLGFNVRGQGEKQVDVVVEVNAHPPTSVLLTLPLALLPYSDAVLVWNLISLAALLASLWVIQRQLRIPLAWWSIFPFLVLALLFGPLRQQVNQGQLNLVLLLLLAGAWAAERSDRPGLAGALVGAAAAIKLFPAFLFLYFALRRQGKALLAGGLSLLLLTAVTAAVLGPDVYTSYFREVVPRVTVFRSSWINASLPGLWTKLFDPATEHEQVAPLWRSTVLAQASSVLSCGLLVLLLLPHIWRARAQAERDRAFALSVIAMLLLSPLTWDHYFMLLLVPLAVVWTQLPSDNLYRLSFLLILALLGVEPVLLCNHLIPEGYRHTIASGVQTLSVLSLQCYALLGLFALVAALNPPSAIRHPPSAKIDCGLRIADCGWRMTAAPYFPPQTLIFLLLWLVLMIGGRSRLLSDPGTLWHTVAGERMLSSGELIYTDPFSFTAAGKRWTPQSWLAECAMALIHRLSGLDSLLLASATLLAALYAWAFQRLLRTGFHPLLAALLLALAMLASAFHFHTRPHLLTLVFLGWTFAQLADFEAGRITLRRLFVLVPLFVLWANVHGGMVGGLCTLAVVAAGWVFAKTPASGGREPPVSSQQGAYAPRSPVLQVFWLILLVAACGLAAFVNPYGAALPRVWLALVRSPILPQLIEEHAPIWNSGTAALAVLPFAVVYLAALLGVLPARPRFTWLAPLLWLGLTCQHIRHGPLFAITALLALADMAPQVRWMRWLAHQGSDLFSLQSSPQSERGTPVRALLLPAVLVGAAIVLQLASCPVPLLGRNWAQLDPSRWPTDLLAELETFEQSTQPGTPILNDMLFGGFLIYYTPRLPVFIDDRCELYGDELLSAYARALGDDPAQIGAWAAQYGFDAALVQTGNALDHYLENSAAWNMVRRTEAATLYRRSQEP